MATYYEKVSLTAVVYPIKLLSLFISDLVTMKIQIFYASHLHPSSSLSPSTTVLNRLQPSKVIFKYFLLSLNDSNNWTVGDGWRRFRTVVNGDGDGDG